MGNEKSTIRALSTRFWLEDKVRWENGYWEIKEVRITKEGISYQLSQNYPVNRTVAYVDEYTLVFFNNGLTSS